MKRPFFIWLLFSLCAGLLLGVTVWASIIVIRLESENAQALQKAELEESIRLAMWRLDSAVAPLIARETARPYFEYSAYYPAERAYTRMFENVAKGEILIPSPLLLETPEYIDIYFQFDPDGNLTSPQFSSGQAKNKNIKQTKIEIPLSQENPFEEPQIKLERGHLIALLPEIDAKKDQPGFPQELLISQVDTNVGKKQFLKSIQSARNEMEQQARSPLWTTSLATLSNSTRVTGSWCKTLTKRMLRASLPTVLRWNRWERVRHLPPSTPFSRVVQRSSRLKRLRRATVKGVRTLSLPWSRHSQVSRPRSLCRLLPPRSRHRPRN